MARAQCLRDATQHEDLGSDADQPDRPRPPAQRDGTGPVTSGQPFIFIPSRPPQPAGAQIYYLDGVDRRLQQLLI
jgi:hypothetical protein